MATDAYEPDLQSISDALNQIIRLTMLEATIAVQQKRAVNMTQPLSAFVSALSLITGELELAACGPQPLELTKC